MNNVYFTSDLHFGHRRILELYPNRPFAATKDIDAHDEYLIQRWNEIADKGDDIYILGDFSLRSVDETRKILERLNGRKYLCPGNHDSSIKSLEHYFIRVQQIMDVRFKATRFPFLKEDVRMVLCHYPLLEWDGINDGVIHLHGHSHGALVNCLSPFRYDVGIDSISNLFIPFSELAKVITVENKLEDIS